MTRDETKKIIRIMAATYPNYKPIDISETIDVWTMLLTDFTYEQISMALKTYIMTNTSGFAPDVGQLIENVRILSLPEELNEMEAWALVSKAIRNGYYGAEQEFKKFPELVQKAVGTPSQLRQWALSDMKSIETVIQSNFIKTYRTVCDRSVMVSKMPKEVLKLYDSINAKPMLKNSNLSQIQMNGDS